MTTKNRMTLAGTAAFLALTLFGFTPAIASEVTGTLTAGASAPAGGSAAGGTINGSVGTGSTISGTVSGGSSGGSGSGNGNNGSVLGASIQLAQADIPGLPNTGGGGEAVAGELSSALLNALIAASVFSLAAFDKKKKASMSKI